MDREPLQAMKNRAGVKTWVGAFATMFAMACTNTGLHQELGPPAPPPSDTIKLKGTFCTEDPQTVKYPVKIWFAIDDTGSMQNNDPNEVRYNAAKALAIALQDTSANPAMYFGGITFANNGATDVKEILPNAPPHFTNQSSVFVAAVNAVQNPGNGGTPYLSPLNTTYADLQQDIAADPVIARRTRYVVIFLSDGQPTDGSSPDQDNAAVDQIVSLKQFAGDVTLNTVLLGGDAGPALLMGMAQHGNGIFKSFPNGDTLDYKDFDFSAIRRSFNQRFFMASNLNAWPDEHGQELDSDGDGIPDYKELQLGTDATKRDTDGDGCSDLMEINVGWDPLIPGTQNNQCSCTAAQRTTDTDGDGLTDCEEKWIGTDAMKPDSDKDASQLTVGDLVPDGLDYTYLADPLFPNNGSDYDADGFSDLQELQTHTSPRFNDSANRAEWAYDYVYLNQEPDNPRCYDFEIDNVTVFQTLATATHAAGENDIELYFSQSPLDDASNEKSFRIATQKIPFSAAGSIVKVKPTDFSVLLQNLH